MNCSAKYHRAFNRAWFSRHQSVLLWLLNAPVVRLWFRWVMCIRPHDCARRTRILEIAPNAFVVYAGFWSGAHHFRADFRTHDKWGKRLYYAFRPLWWAMHIWDWTLADRWMPEWSFGFTTLTVYPDPDPEVSSFDGRVSYNADNLDWSTLVGGSTANLLSDSGATNHACLQEAYTTTNKWSTIARSIFLFKTSDLTANAVISAAVMSLYGSAKSDGLSATPNVNIYACATASLTAVTNTDYGAFGSTAFCDTAVTYAGFSITGYNDFAFNAAGLAAISKTGTSKFGSRNAQYDVANSAPPWVSGALSRLTAYNADQSGTANDPKLVVTYTCTYAESLTLAVSSGMSSAASCLFPTATTFAADSAVAESALIDALAQISLGMAAAAQQASNADMPTSMSLASDVILSPSALADLMGTLSLTMDAGYSPSATLIASVAAALAADASISPASFMGVYDVAVSLTAQSAITQAMDRYVSGMLGLSSSAEISPAAQHQIADLIALGVAADVQASSTMLMSVLVSMGMSAAEAAMSGQVFAESLTLSIGALIRQVSFIGLPGEIFRRVNLSGSGGVVELRDALGRALLRGAPAETIDLKGD